MKQSKGKFAGTVRVGERGQIVIPKGVRDLFDIHPGDTLLVLADVKQGIAIIKDDVLFRQFDEILSKEERGEELGAFVDETLTMAKENSAKIKEEERVSVMYTSGADGLATNAKGSTQAQVLDIVGVDNAIVVEKVSDKGGGNQINLETAMLADPDVIVFGDKEIVKEVASLDGWKEIKAVKEGKYCTVPSLPYNWLANPPSMNMILGVWWLGNLVYPQYYDYDIGEKAREIYSLLWGYDLSDSEIADLEANSTF